MKQKILIIDDDASLRRVLEYNLQEAGFAVTAASSGEEGLALFTAAPYPLVITDMKMPGMDGLQLMTSIKSLSPGTLVIMITAFGTVDIAVQAMKAGAYDYITKPFNRDELLLTVAKALQLINVEAENRKLKEELTDRSDFRTLIGASPQMEKVCAIVRKIADTDASVLITGESGTGKELVARSIHSLSSRKDAPFIAVNCSAIPRDLLESELFGHLKGAFTGAVRDKPGKFELADGGTIFLDEVGELPLELQPKLLRALQEKEIEPVGSSHPRKIDFRVIAATNLDIEKALGEASFREDLYYRLAVIPIHLPPLRERKEDIKLLLKHFCVKHGAKKVAFDEPSLAAMLGYSWPGNVRELENMVERLLIMRSSDSLTLDDIPDKVRASGPAKASGKIINLPEGGYPLEKLEQEIVTEALNRCSWNQAAAARFLKIPRHTLIYRMEKYGIIPAKPLPEHESGKE